MRSIRTELARLRERALARRAEREHRCICELVFVAGEPTPEQAEVIAHNATCPADHGSGFSVVEAPPMPEWMKRGESPPPRAASDDSDD
jgi:hypothetical protein